MLPINGTSIVVVKVSVKENKKGGGEQAANKNGELPFIMKPMAGKIPQNAMTIDGTVAMKDNFVVGLNVVQVTRKEDSAEYGEQYSVDHIGTCTPIELVTQYLPTLGRGSVIMSVVQEAPAVEEVAEEVGAVD